MAGGLFLGLNSGTSADAIDAALVRLDAEGQPVSTLDAITEPLDEELKGAIRSTGAKTPLASSCALDQGLAEAFAKAANHLLERTTPDEPIAAIGAHGQTVWHAGSDPSMPTTVQLGDPNRIASRTGLPVVTDFRRRDIAEGGEGAPLTPAFHAHCWRREDCSQAILNLGGIANLTFLPPKGPVTGFDTGPANTLLDAWARRHLGAPYDPGGRWAAGGTVDEALLRRLRAAPFFRSPPPKSTGPEHFSLGWLDAHRCGQEAPEDIQATLAELTAATVAEALELWAQPPPERLWICGGGARNDDLYRRLRRACLVPEIATTASLGIHPDFVEAIAFAWLAWARLNHYPGNLPSVTGASRPAVLGAAYAP